MDLLVIGGSGLLGQEVIRQAQRGGARLPHSGIHHLAGVDALSRHELGVRIARRDGLDDTRLPSGLRAQTGPPGPLEVRLDCVATQSRLKTRLRGAREFLTAALDHGQEP